MGYGGGYLHSGLSGISGERYAADDLRVPERTGLTQTAQGGTTRALYGPSPRLSKVYGQIPLEEIEGHQVDPFYDVRGTGLGQVPTLARRDLVPSQVNASPPELNEKPLPFGLPSAVLYGALALLAWQMFGKEFLRKRAFKRNAVFWDRR